MKNTKNIKHKKKHPKHEKNMNENITTTQKYEKYYHNAKKYEKPEKCGKHKIYGSGREAGETPATLASLAAPTENRMIVGLAAFLYFWTNTGINNLTAAKSATIHYWTFCIVQETDTHFFDKVSKVGMLH